jgi:hypothetical protein
LFGKPFWLREAKGKLSQREAKPQRETKGNAKRERKPQGKPYCSEKNSTLQINPDNPEDNPGDNITP